MPKKEPLTKRDLFLHIAFGIYLYCWVWYVVSLFLHHFNRPESVAFFKKVIAAHWEILLGLLTTLFLYVVSIYLVFIGIAIYENKQKIVEWWKIRKQKIGVWWKRLKQKAGRKNVR